MVHATKKEATEAGKTCITISDVALRREPILANRPWLLKIIYNHCRLSATYHAIRELLVQQFPEGIRPSRKRLQGSWPSSLWSRHLRASSDQEPPPRRR